MSRQNCLEWVCCAVTADIKTTLPTAASCTMVDTGRLIICVNDEADFVPCHSTRRCGGRDGPRKASVADSLARGTQASHARDWSSSVAASMRLAFADLPDGRLFGCL